MKVPSEFPVTIKEGSCAVKIYRSANKGYTEFKVVQSATGTKRRRFKAFAEYEDARKEADRVVQSLSSGNVEVLKLTNEDRLIYLRACAVLQKVQVPLDLAATEFAKAM